jgi:hypothetical protein
VHVLDGLPVRLHVDALAEAGRKLKQELELHGDVEGRAPAGMSKR